MTEVAIHRRFHFIFLPQSPIKQYELSFPYITWYSSLGIPWERVFGSYVILISFRTANTSDDRTMTCTSSEEQDIIFRAFDDDGHCESRPQLRRNKSWSYLVKSIITKYYIFPANVKPSLYFWYDLKDSSQRSHEPLGCGLVYTVYFSIYFPWL